MNGPEKLSILYARLNGFLLLPHFTIFDGKHYTHADFIGIKPGNGKEICKNVVLPVDKELFNVFDSIIEKSLEMTFGLVGEIKGNKTKWLLS